MPVKPSWDQALNILCVRPDHLGDVLMTTPALRALKQSHPNRRLTLLTSSISAEAARCIPEVDAVIRYDAPWMKSTPGRDAIEDFVMLETLARRKFDAAVIFTVYSQNPLPAAFLCFMAGIPLRLAHCRENPYQMLTNWVREIEPHQRVRHEVERQLDLVGTIGCHTADRRLSFRVPPFVDKQVLQKFELIGAQMHRSWLLIHPGATAPSRRYPAHHFAEAARRLVRDLGYQVIFTGSESERELVESIRDAMRVESYSLVGKLSLPQLAALIARAPVLVANNTGPVHIAAAVGTPVVDLYALTNPQHTPWLVPNRVLFHDVSCKYCYQSVCPQGHHDCLQRVAPERVVTAVQELTRESKKSNLVSFPIRVVGRHGPTAHGMRDV
jgi:lipopolysaccharide heptosyltransferase II